MLFQLTAALLLLAFYGCYFYKMARQRRRGIRTDQLGRGKTGLAFWIEAATKAVTSIVPVAEVYSIWRNSTCLSLPLRLAGAYAGLAGVLVFILSVRTMGDSWRAGVPAEDRTALVTTGIYRVSRNPAFLGFDLLYFGILLLFFSRPLCILSLAAAGMLHLQIVRVEEPFLTAAFGAAYRDYAAAVRRYFGRRRSPGAK